MVEVETSGDGKYGECPRRRVASPPYTWGDDTYRSMADIWGRGEQALPGDPPGELEVASAFATDYAPEEMFEIAKKRYTRP